MPNYTIKKLILFVVAAILVTMNLPTPTLAKPFRIREGVSFDLEACRRTLDGNDVVCTGTLLSRSGDAQITVDRVYGEGLRGSTYIATSQGKTHIPSEISVGPERKCKSDDSSLFNNCDSLAIILIEGVKYDCSFIFRDVSSTPTKIALFTISFGYGSVPLKYRNLSIFQMR